jgi:hypothetical protein
MHTNTLPHWLLVRLLMNQVRHGSIFVMTEVMGEQGHILELTMR